MNNLLYLCSEFYFHTIKHSTTMKKFILFPLMCLLGMMSAQTAKSQEIMLPATLYATGVGSTMYLHYDEHEKDALDPLGFSTKWSASEGTNKMPQADREKITKVVISSSMEEARPTSCYKWFDGLTNVTSIEGLENLNTSKVTTMAYMFHDCMNVSSLDVVEFQMENVESTAYMFANCSSVESLDVRWYVMKSAKDISYMFAGDLELTTIYFGANWGAIPGLENSENMFLFCTKLRGAQGTTYNANHVDASYAHVDGGTSNPGYFTSPFPAPTERIVVTECALTGFNQNTDIYLGMTWDEEARDKIIAAVQPVDPEAVYHVDGCSLTKLHADNIGFSFVQYGTVLDEGTYWVRFWVSIDGRNGRYYCFPYDVAEKVTTTMNGESWAYRRESIGDRESSISMEGPRFTLENATPEQIEEAREMLNQWGLIMEFAASVMYMNGNVDAYNELYAVAMTAVGVMDDPNATLSQLNEQIQLMQKALDKYAEEIWAAAKDMAKSELNSMLDPDDSEEAKQIIADAVAKVDQVPNQTTALGIMSVLVPQLTVIMEETEAAYDTQIEAEVAVLKEELEIYLDAAFLLAEYKLQKGDAAASAEIVLAADNAVTVYDDEYASKSDVSAQIEVLKRIVTSDLDELMAAVRWGYTFELEQALDKVEDESCKQALREAIDALNALQWDNNKTFVENYNIISAAADLIMTRLDEKIECDYQGLDNVDAQNAAVKRILNGQLIIERNGKRYHVSGVEVK